MSSDKPDIFVVSIITVFKLALILFLFIFLFFSYLRFHFFSFYIITLSIRILFLSTISTFVMAFQMVSKWCLIKSCLCTDQTMMCPNAFPLKTMRLFSGITVDIFIQNCMRYMALLESAFYLKESFGDFATQVFAQICPLLDDGPIHTSW